MSQTTNLDWQKALPGLAKQAVIWGPIVGGLVHQFLMFFFNIDWIYVFVNPPGYITPFVSLEYTWWFVLLVGSSLISLLIYSGRLQNIPKRTAIPFYAYVLFLLFLVKPV
ncbi:MAG: hypothetical protein JXM69_06465 [Anaerolineae bacterium]|nr:hypothetical protein [Anaerolineae bacterium]